jgi:hypothetical protein
MSAPTGPLQVGMIYGIFQPVPSRTYIMRPNAARTSETCQCFGTEETGAQSADCTAPTRVPLSKHCKCTNSTSRKPDQATAPAKCPRRHALRGKAWTAAGCVILVSVRAVHWTRADPPRKRKTQQTGLQQATQSRRPDTALLTRVRSSTLTFVPIATTSPAYRNHLPCLTAGQRPARRAALLRT